MFCMATEARQSVSKRVEACMRACVNCVRSAVCRRPIAGILSVRQYRSPPNSVQHNTQHIQLATPIVAAFSLELARTENVTVGQKRCCADGAGAPENSPSNYARVRISPAGSARTVRTTRMATEHCTGGMSICIWTAPGRQVTNGDGCDNVHNCTQRFAVAVPFCKLPFCVVNASG